MTLNKMNRFTCAAPNCKMRTHDFTPEQSKLAESNYIVSFHKFPVDEEKRNAWIAAANRKDWKPDVDSRICSLHFKDDCYDENNQLTDHAVPTIFFENFRTCLKNMINTMGVDVHLEFAENDSEDILSKSLQNLSPVDSDIEEVIEVPVSDDEYDIECEEIICDDKNENQQVNKEIVRFFTNKNTNTPLKVASAVQKSISVTKSIKPITDDLTTKTISKQHKDPPLSNNIATKNSQVDIKNIKTNKLSTNPSETVSKLHTLIQSNSFNASPFMQPASRSLVIQLLNIVKMANAPNVSQSGSSVANTYIITTKQEYTDPDAVPKIKSMETSEIVLLITSTVQAIKDGVFQKTDSINIICASPAIFLIKNVIVNNFDRNMNSVYVITSENLVPYLIKLNTKNKAESGQAESSTIVVKPAQTTKTNISTTDLPNVIISEAKSAGTISKMIVTTVENSPTVSPIITTKTSASKPIILPRIDAKKTEIAPLVQLRMPNAVGQGGNTKTSFLTKAAVPISVAIPKSSSASTTSNTRIKTGIVTTSKIVPIAPKSSQIITSSGLQIKTGEIIPVSSTATVSITTANQITVASGVEIKTATLLPISTTTTPKSIQTAASHQPTPAPSAFRGTSTTNLVNVNKLQQSFKSAFQSPSTSSPNTSNVRTSGVAILPKSIKNITPLVKFAVPKTSCKVSSVTPSTARTSTSSTLTVNAAKLKQTNALLVKKNSIAGTVSTTKKRTNNTLTMKKNSLTGAVSTPNLNQTVALPTTTTNTSSVTPKVGTLVSPTLASIPQIVRNVTSATRFVHVPNSRPNLQPIKPNTSATSRVSKAPKRILEIDLTSSSPPDLKRQAVDIATPDPDIVDIADIVMSDPKKHGNDDAAPNPKTQDINIAIVADQKNEILRLEKNIIKAEREINALKRKILTLKKRYLMVRNPVDTKPDEKIVEDVLKKYLEQNAVQFFIAQMKVSGKTYTQFRWSEEDKLFALGLLYKNPSEYHLLGQKYDLPSDKTLTKFVSVIKRAEMDSKKQK